MKLYDVIDNKEKCYLIMENCPGRNLHMHVRKQAKTFLTEDTIKPIFAQIVGAVAHIH